MGVGRCTEADDPVGLAKGLRTEVGTCTWWLECSMEIGRGYANNKSTELVE